MDKDEKINYKSILLHEIHKVLSYDDAESGKYTNKDYVRKINDWAKLKEFSEHIKVVEIPDDEYKEFLTRKNMSGYKIYIEKLEIIYSRECAEKGSYNFTFDRNKIVGITNESYEQVDFDIHLYIKNCKFKKTNKFPENDPRNNYLPVSLKIENYVKAKIESCIFNLVDLDIGLSGKNDREVVIHKCDFQESSLCIDSTEYLTKPKRINAIENFNNEPNSSIVSIDNNKQIQRLALGGSMDVEFVGKNTINQLQMKSPIPLIKWNAYQEITSTNKSEIETHKFIFLELKKRAKLKEDIFQEKFFQFEIVKCEHKLIKNEPKNISRQERLILGWSKFTSNYGTSWWRPLRFLLIINIIIATLTLPTLMGCCPQPASGIRFFQIIIELFLPLTNLSKIIICEGFFKIYISTLSLIHKAIYFALVYEAVKSFRRFSGR